MTKELIKQLNLLYKQCLSPFPREDIHFLQDNHNASENLYFDFNDYSMTLAGYSSWSFNTLKWQGEWLENVKSFLSCNFFEQYPQYEKLKIFINEQDTPKLYKDLVLCEKLRAKLLEIVETIENKND